MDEVDGMSAGDRGGVADLLQTIHKSKVPIIAICNDKYSQKLRSLRNHTLELDYRLDSISCACLGFCASASISTIAIAWRRKPTAQQISKRMLDVARQEGLSVNEATMQALVEGANGDLRLILGQLQMVRLRAASLTYDDVRGGAHGTSKDFEMSPFEAARQLLSPEGSRLSIGDQVELVFQDMDLVPLLVQENYLNHRPNLARNDAMRMQVWARLGVAASEVKLLTSFCNPACASNTPFKL